MWCVCGVWLCLSSERVTGVGGRYCYVVVVAVVVVSAAVVFARLSVNIRDMSTIQFAKCQLTAGAAQEMAQRIVSRGSSRVGRPWPRG